MTAQPKNQGPAQKAGRRSRRQGLPEGNEIFAQDEPGAQQGHPARQGDAKVIEKNHDKNKQPTKAGEMWK
jgi:hypothetical protein